MCVEINYVYPWCACIVRIGKYTCYHAACVAQTGYSVHCKRFKKTVQEKRTGKIACTEHEEEAEQAKEDDRISEGSQEDVMIENLKGVKGNDHEGHEGSDVSEGSDGEGYDGGLDADGDVDSDMGGTDSETARLLG